MKIVLTTINPPSKIEHWRTKGETIIIGDAKTDGWEHEGDDYYSLERQNRLPFSIVNNLMENNYSRKNIGYLLAMEQGADCIYESDDDNCPNENWKLRERECWAASAEGKGWCNVYASFSKLNIWPRGLPLEEINKRASLSDPTEISSPIHQGLADKSPDVDAIWRLVIGGEMKFEYQRSVHLPPGTWSPFNSQSTWWFKEAFPLMYLPQYCTMRMTDIIRSFVAQRCLWEMGYGVVFHSPSEVVQERNPHNLMRDFEDEIQGYLRNDEIKIALDGLALKANNIYRNIVYCYMELVAIGVLPKEELLSLNQWLNDVNNILHGSTAANLAKA